MIKMSKMIPDEKLFFRRIWKKKKKEQFINSEMWLILQRCEANTQTTSTINSQEKTEYFNLPKIKFQCPL